jgi:large subunit ribosomal protein L21
VYAIIQAGGRQVKVAPGATVELDGKAAETGREVTFDQVLFLARDGGELLAGAPYVSGARVIGVVDGEARGPKIRVFKKKRRKGFRKQAGHRSFFTKVRITEISG